MTDDFRYCGSFDNREDEQNKDVPSEDESGVLFYVNKDGFPINKKTWERMWRHVEKIHPKGTQMVQSVRHNQQLAKVINVSSKPYQSIALCTDDVTTF